jgi:hypothetical protein
MMPPTPAATAPLNDVHYERLTFTGDLAGVELFAELFGLFPAMTALRIVVTEDPDGAPYAIRIGAADCVLEGGHTVRLSTIFKNMDRLRPFLLTLGAKKDDVAVGRPGQAAVGRYEVRREDVERANVVVVRLSL